MLYEFKHWEWRIEAFHFFNSTWSKFLSGLIQHVVSLPLKTCNLRSVCRYTLKILCIKVGSLRRKLRTRSPTLNHFAYVSTFIMRIRIYVEFRKFEYPDISRYWNLFITACWFDHNEDLHEPILFQKQFQLGEKYCIQLHERTLHVIKLTRILASL